MKIAFLILAHKNPKQLNRLVDTLSFENADIFVHIDKKCSLSSTDIKGNVIFTDKRYDIGLYEFSMVEAELELINTAKKHDNYDYYVMMSAQCYPARKVKGIYDFLEKKYPEPFIEIISQKEDNYVEINYERVYINKRFILKSYAFLKKHFPYKLFRILRFIPGGIARINSIIKEIIFKSPKNRLEDMGITGYCGSQWWILPDKVIDSIEKIICDKNFTSAISDVYSCDESFFQTAIMASDAKSMINLDESGDFKNSVWFFDFVDGSHPRVLTKHDYDAIVTSGKLFARKFETEIDEEIFDMLDSAGLSV